MEILRCKTPDMIRREVLMYLIAYNCIRRLIQNIARNKKQSPITWVLKAAFRHYANGNLN